MKKLIALLILAAVIGHVAYNSASATAQSAHAKRAAVLADI